MVNIPWSLIASVGLFKQGTMSQEQAVRLILFKKMKNKATPTLEMISILLRPSTEIIFWTPTTWTIYLWKIFRMKKYLLGNWWPMVYYGKAKMDKLLEGVRPFQCGSIDWENLNQTAYIPHNHFSISLKKMMFIKRKIAFVMNKFIDC